MQTIDVPLVLLTATMPMHMECDAEVTMTAATRLEWIRACTARKATT
jgi:hypothetical protein